jgi:[acyl-carrier-protein] S-malonyltransferase
MSPRIAFVFPGQGAQAVGMGQDFVQASAKAKSIFDRFDAALKAINHDAQPISEVCFNGPEETLKQTLYTQPAILAKFWRLLWLHYSFFKSVARFDPL